MAKPSDQDVGEEVKTVSLRRGPSEWAVFAAAARKPEGGPDFFTKQMTLSVEQFRGAVAAEHAHIWAAEPDDLRVLNTRLNIMFNDEYCRALRFSLDKVLEGMEHYVDFLGLQLEYANGHLDEDEFDEEAAPYRERAESMPTPEFLTIIEHIEAFAEARVAPEVLALALGARISDALDGVAHIRGMEPKNHLLAMLREKKG